MKDALAQKDKTNRNKQSCRKRLLNNTTANILRNPLHKTQKYRQSPYRIHRYK